MFSLSCIVCFYQIFSVLVSVFHVGSFLDVFVDPDGS